MMTREAVEAILKDHELLSQQGWDGAIEAILALVPAPSREGLENILKYDYHLQEWFEDHPEVKRYVLDGAMAWALGQPERRWCEHIVWRDMDRDICTYSGYVFIGNGKSSECLNDANKADDWVLCPVKGCVAPRPP